MTNLTDQIVNANDFPGRYELGSRVWGPNGNTEILGDRIEDFLAACEKVIPKDTKTQYELFYVLDEYDMVGGTEGDIALFEYRESDSDIPF